MHLQDFDKYAENNELLPLGNVIYLLLNYSSGDLKTGQSNP